MDFTVTIADARVARVDAAFGFSGTNAQRKAQFEAWLRQQVKSEVLAREAAAAGAAKAAEVQAETW